MVKQPRYPIGEQSFSALIEGGFLYVDKTHFIEKIVDESKYYFLGRPRRFGKSLFLSTLKCFFEGRRLCGRLTTSNTLSNSILTIAN